MPYELIIDEKVKKAWPGMCLGCVSYAVDVIPKEQKLWEYLEQSLLTPLQKRLDEELLTDMPGIADARAAYKAFGIDPGRHRVSSEALYRRVRQGNPLYQINSLVDANNLVSLETGMSLGSYDAARIGSKITFRLGDQGESYPGIGKSAINLENMPLLADNDGPFGSPTSDSTRAMISLETKNGLTVIYSFSGRPALEAALELAKKRLTAYAGVSNMETFLV